MPRQDNDYEVIRTVTTEERFVVQAPTQFEAAMRAGVLLADESAEPQSSAVVSTSVARPRKLDGGTPEVASA